MSNFLTVSEDNEYTEVIERSKFICYTGHVESEEDAKEFLNAVKKRHSIANHWCYAYIADDKGLVQKFSDDGEPQGTAGLPMLGVLKNRKIYQTIVVVTRYFGGIKLGTGGLTRAYGGTASKCLDGAKIKKMQSVDFVNVRTDYDGYVRILGKKNLDYCRICSTDFAQDVTVRFAVNNELGDYFLKFKEFISDLTKGSAEIEKISDGYYCF